MKNNHFADRVKDMCGGPVNCHVLLSVLTGSGSPISMSTFVQIWETIVPESHILPKKPSNQLLGGFEPPLEPNSTDVSNSSIIEKIREGPPLN